MSQLAIVPITLTDARTWMDRVHRHYRAPQGGKFAVAVAREEEVVGVAIVGRVSPNNSRVRCGTRTHCSKQSERRRI